jgi:hypothetical protein
MMQTLNIRCYPCEELLSKKNEKLINFLKINFVFNLIVLARRDVFYLYFCNNCQNKTPYCKKCDKTMDCLLDSTFFKCMFCKSFMKINMRETVFPENSEMNSSPNKAFVT